MHFALLAPSLTIYLFQKQWNVSKKRVKMALTNPSTLLQESRNGNI